MTISNSTIATLLVAIDISKHRHEVLIGIPGKKRRRRLTITNMLEEFQRLASTGALSVLACIAARTFGVVVACL